MPEELAEVDAEYSRHRDRGLLELAAGRLEEAIRSLGRAVHLRPGLAEAQLNIARAFELAGKTEAARRAYLRAVKIDAACVGARSALELLPSLPPGREDFQKGQRVRSSTSLITYEILDVKKGGFGVVYIAQKDKGGGLRALKTFQAQFLWSDEDRERFKREASIWVMLDRHPNIAAALGMESIEGFACLELEYVPGGSLAQLLQQGPLPVERALELGVHFCDGMEYAHRKLGIVHRDVKPANCLLSETGSLKVTDFGLARAFGDAQERLLGLSGLDMDVKRQYTTTSGTLPYMAPEQFKPNAELDTRTDVYAFGIMLYQMLTCDLPVIGTIAQEHIRVNAEDNHVPEALLALIMQCVEPEPANRPANFGDLRKALGTVYLSVKGKASSAATKPIPMGAEDWNGKGISLWTLGRHEEAIACYDRALEIDERRSHLWQNKGLALASLGRHEEAIACYERGLELEPRHRDFLKNQGMSLWSLGRQGESIACIDRAIDIDPQDPILWKNKGFALGAMGRHEEAIACYERGLQIDVRNGDLWLQKGMVLTMLDRFEEAIVCYDSGLEVEPRKRDLWKSKGFALWLLKRPDEAMTCFNRGLEIDGSDTDLWAAKGLMLSELGRQEEAIACCNKGLQVASNDSRLKSIKAGSLKALGRPPEAEAANR